MTDRAEQKLHVDLVGLVEMMARPGWIYWHTPNGEARTKATAGILKAMGVRAGVMDLAFLSPEGDLSFLELKAPGKQLTKAQEWFGGELDRRGIVWTVADNSASAIQFLKRIGILDERVRVQ